jgi:hypothetical protein
VSTVTIRLQFINLIGKPLFASGDCTDTQVACFVSFVVKHQLQALVPGIFAEDEKKPTSCQQYKENTTSSSSKEPITLPSTSMTPKELFQAFCVKYRGFVDAKNTNGFYNQCIEFSQAVEAVRRKGFTVPECKEIDEAVREMYEVKNNQSGLLLMKDTVSKIQNYRPLEISWFHSR